ncbi:MAG: hypothetical protein C3F11_03620 [Methylocystaceae bacterium]|nr:MAG: hypothetical protein C3F11_03620 [Methylocystaceae bacterium]
MSAAVAFDTLKFVRKLEAGGFTQAQATAAAEAFAEATSQELATKSDLRDVEVRLEAKIETTAANLKVDILRWLVVTQVALGGFIFAAFKFVK